MVSPNGACEFSDVSMLCEMRRRARPAQTGDDSGQRRLVCGERARGRARALKQKH